MLATALIDTGSRADEVIFEEFKEVEIWKYSWIESFWRRIYPAINLPKSGIEKTTYYTIRMNSRWNAS